MENKQGENMTEKLEKALEELNGILADINSVRKEEEEMAEIEAKSSKGFK